MLAVLTEQVGEGQISISPVSLLAYMAQSDVHQTGDQDIVGLIPAGLGTFFHGD